MRSKEIIENKLACIEKEIYLTEGEFAKAGSDREKFLDCELCKLYGQRNILRWALEDI